MSARRVTGLVAIAVVLVLGGVAAIAMVMLIEMGEGFRRYFDEGLLGTYESRQVVDVADEGFTIRIGEDWVAMPVTPQGSGEPTALRPALAIDPRHEDAGCFVHVVDGGRRVATSEADLHDVAETWLEPWMREHGFTEGCGGTVGDSWGDKVGFACEGQEVSRGVAWVVPHDSDLVVVTCTWATMDEATSEPIEPIAWWDAHLTMMALEPLADSIDFGSVDVA